LAIFISNYKTHFGTQVKMSVTDKGDEIDMAPNEDSPEIVDNVKAIIEHRIPQDFDNRGEQGTDKKPGQQQSSRNGTRSRTSSICSRDSAWEPIIDIGEHIMDISGTTLTLEMMAAQNQTLTLTVLRFSRWKKKFIN
jgi:hypothetical protein